MPLSHAVLALLGNGPSYGYVLRSNFEEAVGPQWGDVNIGHIYQVLRRLEKSGQITVDQTVSQENYPDRRVYSITETGRSELAQWLDAPTERATGYRDDFILKVLAASFDGPDQVRHVCATQREASMAELNALRALRREHRGDDLAKLTLEAAIAHIQADLAIIELADERASSGDPLIRLDRTQATPAVGQERSDGGARTDRLA